MNCLQAPSHGMNQAAILRYDIDTVQLAPKQQQKEKKKLLRALIRMGN